MTKDNRKILPNDFYLAPNVLDIAENLLGKLLCTSLNEEVCKGKIIEVEAYRGRDDKACHANNGKRTKRNEVMFGDGGRAYIYLCYGIHHLFNVVTNINGRADAILIRALEPLEGMDIMKQRLNSSNRKLTNGPGILSKAMGISTAMNGEELNGSQLWIENGQVIDPKSIVRTTRIGIDYAEEDALLPWRFYEKGNNWVSKK